MPARDDPNPRIAAICLGTISVIAAVMTVYFPRFSCFYELRDIDNYTIELNAAIFGLCFFFPLLCLLLYCKWPHSRALTYFTQVCLVIFCFGTSLYSVSVFSMFDIAAQKLGDATTNASQAQALALPPVKAIEKLLSPDRDLRGDWIKVMSDNNGNASAPETQKTRQYLCRLQEQFQCMMWTESDTCILEDGLRSSTVVESSLDDGNSTNTTAAPQQVTVPCLTCGIFTMNVTQNNRPISCFEAMVDCFAKGREKYTTTRQYGEGSKTYKYVADRYVMIVGGILILILTVVAIWKNCNRSFTEPASYGSFEHGVGEDYRPLRTTSGF